MACPFNIETFFVMNKKYIFKTMLVAVFSLLGKSLIAQTITGTVFNDYDANGQKVTNELGMAGVTVTAYDPAGTAIAPAATTSASGTYTLTGLTAATKYRVEFTNYPVSFFAAPMGNGSNSSVQFATAGATNLNFGIAYPRDFCEKTPDLVVPCFSSGDNLGSAVRSSDVLVKIPYSAANTAPSPTKIAMAGEIGPTFGTSVHRLNRKVFTATFLKRHVGLGPGGLGAIYITDIATNTSQVYVKLQDLGFDVGVSALGARSLPNSLTTSSVDATVFDLVGKAGLGGLALSSDEKTIYTVNLFERTLVKINIGYPIKAAGTITAGDVQSFPIPSASATGGVLRPFALDFYKGKVYVGAVATAETSNSAADLKAYVFEFDVATGTFNPSPILTIANMVYPKGDVHSSYPAVDKWMSWTNVWSGIQLMGSSSAGERACRPQPMLSDLAFTDEGDMVLGFMDRGGHQTGYKQKSIVAGDTKLYNGYIGGDLLRARKMAGTWTLESNGVVGGTQNGCGKGNAQGPDGGEFYCADNYTTIHYETFMGGMLIVPGTNQLVGTAMDPLNVWSGGFTWHSNTDGNSVKRYQIYESTTANAGTAGKANGLGVVDAICSPAPLEIGNRVWKDLDGDGLQDANEPAMAGVTVKLFAADGTTLLGTAVTDVNGNYSFSSGAGTGSASKIYAIANLKPETNYFIRVMALGTDASVSGTTLTSVSPGVTAGLNAGTSLATNDGYLDGGMPTIQLLTGVTGENNHTYDFGFTGCTLNVTAASNSPVCENGTINLTSTGASGSATYAWSGPNAFTSTTQNPIINSANAAKTGVYQVIVTDGGCKDTANVTVALAPFVATATGGTACEGGAFALKSTATNAASWAWTGPNSFTSTLENPTLNPVNAAMAGTYTVVVTSSSGCTASSTANVVVNNITPTAIVSSATFCKNSNIELDATGGGTYAWSGPNSFVSNAKNPVIMGATTANAGTYMVTVTATNGCTGTASVSVTMSNNTATAASNSPVCDGATLNLTASAGISWVWTGPTGFTSTDQNPVITASAVSAGIYTVVITTADGCTSSATTTVFVKSTTATATGGTTCTGGSFQLMAAGGTGYAWSGPSSFTSTAQNPTVSPAVAGDYTVTVTNNGCTATAIATINVVGAPEATVSPENICVGGTMQLMASGGGISYTWSGPNGYSSNQQNPIIANTTTLQSGTYTVTITGSGCSGSPTVDVVINPKPTVTMTVTSPVCEGGNIVLTSSGGAMYAWSGPNAFVSAEQNVTITGATAAKAGNYTVTL
jgi:hypothetical protein